MSAPIARRPVPAAHARHPGGSRQTFAPRDPQVSTDTHKTWRSGAAPGALISRFSFFSVYS